MHATRIPLIVPRTNLPDARTSVSMYTARLLQHAGLSLAWKLVKIYIYVLYARRVRGS